MVPVPNNIPHTCACCGKRLMRADNRCPFCLNINPTYVRRSK